MLQKSIIFLIFTIISQIYAAGQELTIVAVHETADPMTVDMQRRDLNNEICALVQVQLPVSGVVFEGSTIGEPLFKTNEYWVYYTPGTKLLQIKCPGHYPLRIDVRDYGISSLKSKQIYTIRLKTAQSSQGIQQSDPGADYLVLDITPKSGLWVRIDGQAQTVKDGNVRAYLKYGTHTYHIEADGYAPAQGQVTISPGERTTRQIRLESLMASLAITAQTPQCTVFINDEAKGTTPWNGKLAPGLYRIEIKKDGHRTYTENIELAQRDSKTINAPTLTPVTGILNVDFDPVDADVIIDGQKIGLTPGVYNNILTGRHTLKISKDGYQPYSENITVAENKEVRVTGSLKRTEAAQPAMPTASNNDNEVFTVVEQPPQFPGGEAALFKFISTHLEYPESAAENNIQGRVIVKFVVTKTGQIGDIKIVRGKDPDLDKEAVRVVKSLPKFIPGKQNGHAVNAWYILPIIYKLE